MQIICGRTPSCGFRAHDRYYLENLKFARHICPNCNGPIKIVRDNTDTAVPKATMADTGAIVGVED